jgi:DNA-binding transcriptional MocR family regulator
MKPTALPTSERVYQAVRAELLAGAFSPGERIEGVQLAERHLTSITPIRAALHRLTGESLIDARAGEGFHAPMVTEASLRDLYAWNGHVVLLGWQLSSHSAGPEPPAAPDPAQDIPLATAVLFAGIGERSGNEQCVAAINQLNDKLHLARLLEGGLIDDLDIEIEHVATQLGGEQPSEIRQAIAAYHRRRIRLAADLVRLMHRRPR